MRIVKWTVTLFALSFASISGWAQGTDETANTDQIVIELKDKSVERNLSLGAETAKTLSNVLSLKVRHGHFTATGSQVALLPERLPIREVERLVKLLKLNPLVADAWPDYRVYANATPNDSRYSEQWHYFENIAGINTPAAWDTSTGNGVRVAVLDTGYTDHPDLPTMLPGYDFITDVNIAQDGNGRDADAHDPGDYVPSVRESSWHGTHVSGTIAARTNNGVGVAGVAWNSQIVPVRVLGRGGGYTSDVSDAIYWIGGANVVPSQASVFVPRADIINMSLGGAGSCTPGTQNAINYARSRGVTIVVAAGNSNANASSYQPANCSGVIVVAALNRQGNRAFYSNFGAVVDLVAPGGETGALANGVLSTLHSSSTTLPNGSYNYEFYQGTSMAAPHVSGVAALVRSKAYMTPDQLEAWLKGHVRTIPGSCTGGCGTGLVNAATAVNALQLPSVPASASIMATSNCYAELSWTPSTGATYYRLQLIGRGTPTVLQISSTNYDFAPSFGFGSSIDAYVQACNSQACTAQSIRATGDISAWGCED